MNPEAVKDWTFYKSVPATLDEVVLGVWIPGKDSDGQERLGNTYRNGCSYALVVDPAYPVTDPRHFMIGWGCNGVYVNLVQGHARQLMHWLQAQIGERSSEMVPLPITPETQVELLKLKPCERCGSPLFKEPA